jgi:hypothetical protein
MVDNKEGIGYYNLMKIWGQKVSWSGRNQSGKSRSYYSWNSLGNFSKSLWPYQVHEFMANLWSIQAINFHDRSISLNMTLHNSLLWKYLIKISSELKVIKCQSWGFKVVKMTRNLEFFIKCFSVTILIFDGQLYTWSKLIQLKCST